MRIGGSAEETRRLWSALPPLAARAPLGGARPGAAVMAVASSAAGGVFPVVAAQRYGRGRSMVFAGEASWRWKMLLASSDRSYEFFWRQAARWMAGAAADPVTITAPESAGVNDEVAIAVDVRDAAFAPVDAAEVDATLTAPGGQQRADQDAALGSGGGPVRGARSRRRVPAPIAVDADARRGDARLGRADRWMYVGGADREFADPRLNEALLRRVARASGGRYVRAAEASRDRRLAAGSDAAAGGARAPRPVARAVGVCGHRRAVVGGVDPAAAVGAEVKASARRTRRT